MRARLHFPNGLMIILCHLGAFSDFNKLNTFSDIGVGGVPQRALLPPPHFPLITLHASFHSYRKWPGVKFGNHWTLCRGVTLLSTESFQDQERQLSRQKGSKCQSVYQERQLSRATLYCLIANDYFGRHCYKFMDYDSFWHYWPKNKFDLSII